MSNEEVCRQAILRIGTAEQLGPSTQGMLLAQSLLPQVRDSLLLTGSWTWANKSAVLTANVLWPEFKWTYSYALPADCLRVYRVNDTGARTPEAAWEVQGSQLLTDSESEAPAWLTGRSYGVGHAVTEAGRAWSATSIGRWLIVVPFGCWWAAIYLVQIVNPWFGWSLVVVDVPERIHDMALILVPAIVLADAGALIGRRFGK
jgi:hypothetical protein